MPDVELSRLPSCLLLSLEIRDVNHLIKAVRHSPTPSDLRSNTCHSGVKEPSSTSDTSLYSWHSVESMCRLCHLRLKLQLSVSQYRCELTLLHQPRPRNQLIWFCLRCGSGILSNDAFTCSFESPSYGASYWADNRSCLTVLFF